MNGLGCNADALLLDKETTNMNVALKFQFERPAGLPERNQRTLIDVIENYCISAGLQGYLKDGNKGSLFWMGGKTPEVLSSENEE